MELVRVKPLPRVEEVWPDACCPAIGCGAARLTYERTLFAPGHTAAELRCVRCTTRWICDLPVGHGAGRSYWYQPETGRVVGPDHSLAWFARPFLQALRSPDAMGTVGLSPELRIEVKEPRRRVIVLNTLDAIWGHVFLKLVNAAAHLERDKDFGLVVLVPRALRWLVPDGVSEIWTADVPLAHGRRYFPELDRRVERELGRFDEVRLSPAESHPDAYDIERFSRVRPFSLARHGDRPHRVTFIWREDRLWLGDQPSARASIKLGLAGHERARELFIARQAWRVARLLGRVRAERPAWRFAVAGMGARGVLPSWIEDRRVERYTEASERAACDLYAQSSLVVGVQGSNMLLPSAHAGATIDLVPRGRWGNVTQDVVYQRGKWTWDPRVVSLAHQYLPAEASPATVAEVALTVVAGLR